MLHKYHFITHLSFVMDLTEICCKLHEVENTGCHIDYTAFYKFINHKREISNLSAFRVFLVFSGSFVSVQGIGGENVLNIALVRLL